MTLTPEVVQAFLQGVTEFQASPLGSGHIHQTLLVESKAGSHVFQCLNADVFPQLEQVMDNIQKVTAVLKGLGEPTLDFLPTKSNQELLLQDEKGAHWRCSVHVPETVTYDIPPSPEHLVNAARAFARFGLHLSDAGLELHPIIEGFHDTPERFEKMEAAWNEAPQERQSVADYYALRHGASAFPEFELKGLLAPHVPQAVAHNDSKLNNCLFLGKSSDVACVIDLDTVMPGSWLLDFGDLCRTSICALPEDTQDLDKVEVDLDRFKAIIEGYADVLGDRITPEEQARMVYSAFLLTYELALRFFTDHLEMDRYFGAKIPDHNLIRTRSQMTLALKITAARPEMEEIVAQAFA